MILFFSAGVFALISIALIGMIEPSPTKASVPS